MRRDRTFSLHFFFPSLLELLELEMADIYLSNTMPIDTGLFADFPDDILHVIASIYLSTYLGSNDVLSFVLTCKKWRALAYDSMQCVGVSGNEPQSVRALNRYRMVKDLTLLRSARGGKYQDVLETLRLSSRLDMIETVTIKDSPHQSFFSSLGQLFGLKALRWEFLGELGRMILGWF